MDFSDICSQGGNDIISTTCWYDAIMDNENSPRDNQLSVNIKPQNFSNANSPVINSGIKSLEYGLTSYGIHLTTLNDNLTWNDLNFELTPPSDVDISSYQIGSDSILGVNDDISNIFDYFIESDACIQNNHANNTEIIQQGNFIQSTSKNERNVPDNNFELSEKRSSRASPDPNFNHYTNYATNSSSAELLQNNQLLILPNGEIYQKIDLSLNESQIKNGELICSTIRENTLQAGSPSSSCDSGLTPNSLSTNDIHHSNFMINYQSHTLTDVLLTEPLLFNKFNKQPFKEGHLILTDEEKNCLITHGYPIPHSLPLDKEQERYLKQIRRKIKNKVAAQESRRRRKEYTENLESKVKHYQHEKHELLIKLKTLESCNKNLLNQIRTLTGRVRLNQPSKGGACLMVLVFFAIFIGSWDLKSWNIGYGGIHPSTHPPPNFNPILGPNLPKLHRVLEDRNQKVLSHGPNIEHPLVENYFNVKDMEQNHPEDRQDDLPTTLVSMDTDICNFEWMSPWKHSTQYTNIHLNSTSVHVCN